MKRATSCRERHQEDGAEMYLRRPPRSSCASLLSKPSLRRKPDANHQGLCHRLRLLPTRRKDKLHRGGGLESSTSVAVQCLTVDPWRCRQSLLSPSTRNPERSHG